MSKEDFKVVESTWLGRSLTNYKQLHAGRAEDRGVGRTFQNAKTLTEARKLLFGTKRGQTPVRKV